MKSVQPNRLSQCDQHSQSSSLLLVNNVHLHPGYVTPLQSCQGSCELHSCRLLSQANVPIFQDPGQSPS
jgi:hypothetical protein